MATRSRRRRRHLYEHRSEPLLPRGAFYVRLARHAALATLLVGVSLLIGMLGYEHFDGLDWQSAFLNSAMLLGGMGPVDAPKGNPGKLFAGCYALYAGLVFIAVATIILAPVVHRMLHLFHIDERDK